MGVPVRTFRDLIAWQRAMDLAIEVYKVTLRFPSDEKFALTTQIRRAAVSVASNIAEGQGRGTGKEFAKYLRIARGSLQELETQLLIARRLEYVTEDELNSVLQVAMEVGRLSSGLQKSLKPVTRN